MKLYKPILALSLLIGDYGVLVATFTLSRILKKFACLVGTPKPVATVFTNGLNKCIRISSCNV